MEGVELRLRTDVRGLLPRSADGSWHMSKARLRLFASPLAPHPSNSSNVFFSLRAEPVQQEKNRSFRWELLAHLWLHSNSDLRCLAQYRFPLARGTHQDLQFPARYLRLEDQPKLDLHLTFLRKEDFLLPDFTLSRHRDDIAVTLRMADGGSTVFYVSPHILALHCSPDGRLADLLRQPSQDWTSEFADSEDLRHLLLQLYPTRAEPPLSAIPALAKAAVHLGLPYLRHRFATYIRECKNAPVSWKIMVADSAGLVETVSRAALDEPYEAAELARHGLADFLSEDGADALLGSLAEKRPLFPDPPLPPSPAEEGPETAATEASILVLGHQGQRLRFCRDWLAELLPHYAANAATDSQLLFDDDLDIFKTILHLSFLPRKPVPEHLVRPVLEWSKRMEAELVLRGMEDQLVERLGVREEAVSATTQMDDQSQETETKTAATTAAETEAATGLAQLLALGEEVGLRRLLRHLTASRLRGNPRLLRQLRDLPLYHRLSLRTQMMAMEAVGGEKVGSADVGGADPGTQFAPTFHLHRPPDSQK